ncbi:hypothetical protein BDZ89DRAFT_1039474 [Hymenopellis radicata]|nr:hypothetical protein BDZ89DRAFT_1039474 [Hymenopellis radicata]
MALPKAMTVNTEAKSIGASGNLAAAGAALHCEEIRIQALQYIVSPDIEVDRCSIHKDKVLLPSRLKTRGGGDSVTKMLSIEGDVKSLKRQRDFSVRKRQEKQGVRTNWSVSDVDKVGGIGRMLSGGLRGRWRFPTWWEAMTKERWVRSVPVLAMAAAIKASQTDARRYKDDKVDTDDKCQVEQPRGLNKFRHHWKKHAWRIVMEGAMHDGRRHHDWRQAGAMRVTIEHVNSRYNREKVRLNETNTDQNLLARVRVKMRSIEALALTATGPGRHWQNDSVERTTAEAGSGLEGECRLLKGIGETNSVVLIQAVLWARQAWLGPKRREYTSRILQAARNESNAVYHRE